MKRSLKSERRRRKRVLVLTQYYRPEPNFITGDVADAVAAEADVTVITAHPSYPAGRFYPGTKPWRLSRERHGNVVVWRVPHIPDHSTSKWRRAASYLSFTLSAALTSLVVAGRPDVVWVYHTPFSTAFAALWFRVLGRARLVYTCADLWPESLFAAGVARPGLMGDMLYGYSRWILRFADDVACTTRGTVARFAADGVPPERLHFIPAWTEGIPRILPAFGGLGDDTLPTSVVYAGNLGAAQGLHTVIRAAALLQDEAPELHFDFYGSGVAERELRELAGSLGTRNVTFHGRVTPSEAFTVSATSFAQIATLRPSPLFGMTIPSKLAFCLAAGAPVLCGLEGESAGIAAAAGGTLSFDASSPESLRDAVLHLRSLSRHERDRMRGALRDYYNSHFRRDALLEAYRMLLLKGKPVGGSQDIMPSAEEVGPPSSPTPQVS